MKKSITTLLNAAVFAALTLAAAACEPEANAKLVVKNDLGFDVSELSLTGDFDTGNLLDGATIQSGAVDFLVAKEVQPGVYKWHVSGPKASDDGAEEFELFPGPNHLTLEISLP